MTEPETTISISDHEGMVVMQFSKPTENLVMEPENARQIGEGMARAAYSARYGVSPDQSRSIISDQKRMLLVTRATHIIRSLQDKGKMPGVIASQVVDAILSEVY